MIERQRLPGRGRRVGSLGALLAFCLAILVTNEGSLEPVQDFLRGFVLPRDGPPLTLAAALGLPRWGAIALLVAGAALWLIRSRNTSSPRARPGDWPWWVTGIVIGLIAVLAWPLSAATGRSGSSQIAFTTCPSSPSTSRGASPWANVQ